MLRKGADHTTFAMHDQPARKPLSSSVVRVTGAIRRVPAAEIECLIITALRHHLANGIAAHSPDNERALVERHIERVACAGC